MATVGRFKPASLQEVVGYVEGELGLGQHLSDLHSGPIAAIWLVNDLFLDRVLQILVRQRHVFFELPHPASSMLKKLSMETWSKTTKNVNTQSKKAVLFELGKLFLTVSMVKFFHHYERDRQTAVRVCESTKTSCLFRFKKKQSCLFTAVGTNASI